MFIHKKKSERIIAAVLSLCLIIGTVQIIPLFVKAENGWLSALSSIGSSIDLDIGYVNGAKVTYKDDNGENWQRVSYNGSEYDAETGFHIELSEIYSPASDYSVVMALGNSFNQWTDQSGYILIYGNKGHMEIFPSKNAYASLTGMGNEIVSIDREELGDKLIVDIKLIEKNYIFTVNGATYTFPALNPDGTSGSSIISDPKKLRLAFNISGGIDPVTNDVNLEQKTSKNSTFVISDMSYDYDVKGIITSNIGTGGNKIEDNDIDFGSDDYSVSTLANGINLKEKNANSKVFSKEAYSLQKGVFLCIEDIVCNSQNRNAGLEISIGKDKTNIVSGNLYKFSMTKNGTLRFYEVVNGIENQIINVKYGVEDTDYYIYIQKVADKQYEVIINNKTYTIFDTNSIFETGESAYLSFGFNNSENNSSFSIKKISDELYSPEKVSGFWPSSSNIKIKEANSKLTVSYDSNPLICNEYVYTDECYDISKGLHFNVSNVDIESGADYSIAVSIGDSKKPWYNQDGYMIVYNCKGYFEIASTKKGDSIGGETPLVSVKREKIADGVSIDAKQVKNDLILTINNSTYTVPALEDSNVYLSAGLLGDIVESIDKKISWVKNWSTAKLGDVASFVISNVSDNYHENTTETISDADEVEVASLSNMTFVGEQSKKYNITDDSGVTVNFDDSYQGWERLGSNSLYDLSQGVHFEIDDISSNTDSYSLAVSMGNGGYSQWYDSVGYMLFYDTNGKFSVLAMQGNGANVAETLISLQRETIGNKFTLDIKLIENKYVLMVNSKVYTLPASRENFSLGNAAELSFAVSLSDVIKDFNTLPEFIQFTNAKFTVKKIGNWPEKGNEDDPIEGEEIDPNTVDMLVVGENISIYNVVNGVKIVHEAKAAGWERASYINSATIDEMGYHIKIEDISSKATDYTFALAFGNNQIQWVDKAGYLMLYGNNGDFAIIETSSEIINPNDCNILVKEKREKLGDQLNFEIKLKDDKYIVSVNGKDYTIKIPKKNSPVTDCNNLYFSYGIVSGGEIGSLDFYSNKFKKNNVIFTITDIGSSDIIIPDDKVIGEKINPTEINAYAVGDHIETYKINNNVKIVHGAKAAGWERIGFAEDKSLLNEGTLIDIVDIKSKSKKYSVAIAFGDNLNQWVDKNGYMLIYSNEGCFSIIETSETTISDPNKSKALISENREPLGKDLSIKIKYEQGKYIIVVNNKSYSFTEEEFGNNIVSLSNVKFSFGVISSGQFGNIDFYSDSFKKNLVEYTLKNFFTNNKQEEKSEIDDRSWPGQVKNPLKYDMVVVGSNVKLFKADNGLKVLHTKNAAAWERIGYVKSFSTKGNGNIIKLSDIKSECDTYSVAVAIGNNLNQWVDKEGLMIIYGKNGEFSIISTSSKVNDPNKNVVLFQEKRERLEKDLCISLKLKGLDYILTVNNKEYVISTNKNLSFTDIRNVYYSFGIVGNGTIGNIDFSSNHFKYKDVSFVINEASDEIDIGKEYGLKVVGYNWKLSKSKSGIAVIHDKDGAGWERISSLQSYSTIGEGMNIEVNNINSDDNNYSLVTMLSDAPDPWYDTNGYMIVYSHSGKLSIIATGATVINPNSSPCLISESCEPLTDTMSLNVRQDGEELIIKINGKEYSVPAKHTKYPINDVNNLYVSIGEFNDAQNGDYIYNSTFKKSPLTFTLSSIKQLNNTVLQNSNSSNTDVIDSENKVVENVKNTEDNKTKINGNDYSLIVLFVCIGALLVLAMSVVFVLKKKIRSNKR